MPSGGGKAQRLTNLPGARAWPSFSRDGQWIYFSSDHSGRDEVWKIDSKGGPPIQVTKNGGFMPVESPDGKQLYYMRRSTSGPLYRTPVAGGPESTVLEEIAARGYAPAANGIYFILPPHSAALREYYEVNANYTLQFMDFATGKIRKLANLEKPLQLGITLSPDGRSVLYPQIDQQFQDLVVVENFR